MSARLELPVSIRTSDDVRQLAEWCIDRVGAGYHPDTPAAEYVFDDGSRFFSFTRSELINELHAQVFERADADLIYECGLDAQHRILGWRPEQK